MFLVVVDQLLEESWPGGRSSIRTVSILVVVDQLLEGGRCRTSPERVRVSILVVVDQLLEAAREFLCRYPKDQLLEAINDLISGSFNPCCGGSVTGGGPVFNVFKSLLWWISYWR